MVEEGKKAQRTNFAMAEIRTLDLSLLSRALYPVENGALAKTEA